MDSEGRVPSDGAITEAKNHPNGWVYEIDGDQVDDPNAHIPPRAIRGAWKVDGSGLIVGEFQANPSYRPKQKL